VVHLLLNSLFLIAGLKWGDWKNWARYHSTILFLWFGDLLYNVFCNNHLMWEYKETIFGQELLPNHLTVSLLIMFVAYPATVLIFLGKLPEKKMKIVLWILFWVALFSLVEYINLRFFDLVMHHNGWTMAWSILFNLIIFSMLLLHYKRPIAALIISIPIILFFVIFFKVPIY
jgi:hypothetical protein